jgi:hypothetical protein
MEARRTGARGPCVLQRVWTRGDTRGSRTAAAVVSRSCRAGLMPHDCLDLSCDGGMCRSGDLQWCACSTNRKK